MSRKIKPSTVPQLQTPVLTSEEAQELDYDICCCIEEIEQILSKKATEKQKKLGEVSLKILRNPAESFVKKKQIMRQWCGDYRKKFDSKKKQMVSSLNVTKASFKAGGPVQSVYYKKHGVNAINEQDSECTEQESNNAIPKSSFKASDNSFKFNFQL